MRYTHATRQRKIGNIANFWSHRFVHERFVFAVQQLLTCTCKNINEISFLFAPNRSFLYRPTTSEILRVKMAGKCFFAPYRSFAYMHNGNNNYIKNLEEGKNVTNEQMSQIFRPPYPRRIIMNE